ncbi:YecA/YgfB family protein [Ramlibacter sp. AN1133]|uniref:YecA/YgfB family protein n=1 Tax=Ramlibacter sp. AN1133 TaxID=3133429 RepID=UPI0030BD9AB4
MTNTTAADPGPLTPEDFDALDDTLDLLRQDDEDVPGWEFCEGFLVALVCMRRAVPPEEYWPVLLGPNFRPMEHMEFVWRWRRRWEEIAFALDQPVDEIDDERTYHPEALDMRGAILALPPQERAEGDLDNLPAYAQVWAIGFLSAVESWPEDWQPPRDAEAAQVIEAALEDIAALVEGDAGEPAFSMYSDDGPPSVSDERLAAVAAAIWAAYDLRQVWRSLGPRIEPLRKTPEPGRNDPCPCGSGRKYKKCHGAG